MARLLVRRAFACVVVLAGLAMVAASAQERAGITGTWVASADPPPGVNAAPSSVLGPRFALADDGRAITLTRPARDGTFQLSFPADGTDVRWHAPGPLCHGDAERVERLAWEDASLVFTLVGTVPPGGTELRPSGATYVMRPVDADTLLVETTMAPAEGETARRTVGTAYRRSPEGMPAPPARERSNVASPPARIDRLAWLAGIWIGASGATTVEERWTPAASGAMIAVSRTLRGPQMAAFELLCIVEREGSLAYVAMPGARMPPTFFWLSGIDPSQATFENPTHDFPRLVRYTLREDDSLETTISAGGEDRAMRVVLRRQE
jgi:hypothetical protein